VFIIPTLNKSTVKYMLSSTFGHSTSIQPALCLSQILTPHLSFTSKSRLLYTTTDREGVLILKEFWKGCNIWKAVNNSGDSWDETKESTMHG
jgi:hypothetical protein